LPNRAAADNSNFDLMGLNWYQYSLCFEQCSR
jgi:hypothetical protein